MKKHLSFLVIAIIFVIVALGIVYYQFIIPSQFEYSNSPVTYPGFIKNVLPEPNSLVGFFPYLTATLRSRIRGFPAGKGISVTLLPVELDTKENLLKDGDQIFSLYSSRTTLWVDGKEVSKDKFIPMSGLVGVQFMDNGNLMSKQIIDAGPYWMNWYPVLYPGKHHVELVVENRAGELKNYSWEFVVTLW